MDLRVHELKRGNGDIFGFQVGFCDVQGVFSKACRVQSEYNCWAVGQLYSCLVDGEADIELTLLIMRLAFDW